MSVEPRPARRPITINELVRDARFEIIPLKHVDAQIEQLPVGCSVSVTCSPTKGLDATLAVAERVAASGHLAVPHLSTRLVRDRGHVEELAAWCREHVSEVFLVAGDSPEPVGDYDGVVGFLRDFLAAEHGLRRIGVTAYPDGHALIPTPVLHSALHDKQALLADAGVAGYASTQMCFDAAQWKRWATAERAAGFTLPLHLGVPGVIDRAKLLTMGMRLGIGSSMRYVRKNRGALGRLFTPGGYSPDKVIGTLACSADELGIEGLHLFTFNNVGATAEWQRERARRTG